MNVNRGVTTFLPPVPPSLPYTLRVLGDPKVDELDFGRGLYPPLGDGKRSLTVDLVTYPQR